MGSRRVSSYRSRAMRRTAGSESKKRSGSRTAVTGQDPRIHVTVGRDDGQPARLFVQIPRDAADRGIGIEKAVWVEDGGHGLTPWASSPGRTPAATISWLLHRP